MAQVSYNTYMSDKKAFIEKHGRDGWTVNTSELDSYNRYMKTYIFEDGAEFYELMSPVTEVAEFTHRGIKMQTEVKLFKTEYWSSEFESREVYEKY